MDIDVKKRWKVDFVEKIGHLQVPTGKITQIFDDFRIFIEIFVFSQRLKLSVIKRSVSQKYP